MWLSACPFLVSRLCCWWVAPMFMSLCLPAGALLLDPFRTVVPAAAYSQPTAAEVAGMSLLDAHCGTYQQVRRRRQQQQHDTSVHHVPVNCHTADGVLIGSCVAPASGQPTACVCTRHISQAVMCAVCVQVMLYTWLKANLPSYVTLLGMQSIPGAGACAGAGAGAAAAPSTGPAYLAGAGMAAAPVGGSMGLHQSLSTGNLAGQGAAPMY